MRQWRKAVWKACLVILLVMVVCWQARHEPLVALMTSGPIVLGTLASSGQDAVIDYSSNGCFHSTHYRLRYQPVPTPRLLVTEYNPRLSKNPKTEPVIIHEQPKELAAVELTRAQVVRLDNTLRFYRKHEEGGCTTHDSITVTLYSDGQEVRAERYEDATCQSELFADADPRDLRSLGMNEAPTLSLRSICAVAAQARTRGLNTTRYIEPPREETTAYREVLGKKAEQQRDRTAHAMVEGLEGYAALRREFQVEQVMLGYINLLPYSLHTSLRATTPHLVDAVWWFDPVVNEHAKYDWNQFLALHREIEQSTAAHPWIAAWKKGGENRSVEAQIFGLTANTETDFATHVVPAWRKAGLKGEPRYELLLRQGDNVWVTVYLGKKESRALILPDWGPAQTR